MKEFFKMFFIEQFKEGNKISSLRYSNFILVGMISLFMICICFNVVWNTLEGESISWEPIVGAIAAVVAVIRGLSYKVKQKSIENSEK